MKECSKCGIEKPKNEFYKRNNRKSGVTSKCRGCLRSEPLPDKYKKWARNYEYLRNYGITVNDYNTLLKNQNYSCAICNRNVSEVNTRHKKHLCVDHDHDTNKVRGLLCDKCNRGLGLMNDSIDILESALIYLNKHK